MADKIHEVRKNGSIYFLLNALLGAYDRRTDVMAKGDADPAASPQFDAIIDMLRSAAAVPAELGLVKAELSIIHGLLASPESEPSTQLLTAINNLTRKVDTMSSNVDRIEKETAEILEDVEVVRGAVEGLKAVVTDLKAQLAQGQVDQARLDAAATSLEKIDDNLDAITAPESPA